MKKKCAVFTIVKNESYFLPIWIKHYKKYFSNSDIYVLNHQSNDGSTDNLDVNVIEVVNELAFDHQWLVNTVGSFQSKLLQEYNCVIFAESDELIYSIDKNLNDTIDDFISSDFNYVKCKGYEVIQDLENEKSITEEDSIFDNRDNWYECSLYNKPLLSKVPLNWAWGFHNLSHYPETDPIGTYGLTLCHLHRVDFEFMLKRHEERAKKWNLKNDGNAGAHHRICDRDELLKFFNDVNSEIVKIPKEHKDQLNGI